MHVVCPSCFVVNRVPESRVRESPTCGRCRLPIFDGKPVVLTASGFDRFTTNGDLPVVVDFWAAWCGPCKSMAPVFAQLAAEMATQIRFGKVDVDAESAIASLHDIRSIPTLVLFKHGREIDRLCGAVPAASLRRWLSSR